ncbi:MAG: hypothetical protein HUU46_01655 [Candidatus Hydrogenedentes bacterium]|nr:hypothetical protein [Candidatus Hydrogenedentota bacterium]
MTYRGHVRNGVIVLDDRQCLPEGTEVAVEVTSTSENDTWVERLKDVIGSVDDLPDDMAANHDHYLHGAPRK